MKRQGGMSLIVALFLIVVVALLAAFAINTGNSQRQQTNLQLAADRAVQAAHAGIEWAATRALLGSCVPSSTLNLTQGALNGFTVTITCSATAHTETAPPLSYNIYDVTAFAQYGRFGAAGYVSKTMTARFGP
jgi:MSHA biogenesis protein MshP